MLQEVPFPTGDTCATMPAMPSQPMPPPPSEMPPPPPGFEVPSTGFRVEPPGGPGQLPAIGFRVDPPCGPGQQQQPTDWLSTPGGTPSGPLQPHFPPPRTPSPPVLTPPVWGMASCLSAGAPGTWAPLSTNPSAMTGGGWLSTGVSECDGSAVAVSSAAMTHVAQGCSSATSSAHVPFSMPPPTNADSGLWSAPAASAAAASMAPASMLSAAGLVPMMHIPQPMVSNQLRAEAAPYVPMNMGVGVPAY